MREKTPNEAPQKPKRWRIRFGIRTLIVGTALIGLVLALLLQTAIRYSQRKNQARTLIESVGGQIEPAGLSLDGPPGKNWLTCLTGISHGAERLWTVDLSGSSINARQIATLSGCDWIRDLDLSNTKLTDDDLGFLDGLPKIRVLKLNGTSITDKGLTQVKSLQRLVQFETDATGVTWEGLTELDNSLAGNRAFADLSITSTFPRDGVSIESNVEYTEPGLDEFGFHLGYEGPAREAHVMDGSSITAETIKDLRKLTRLRSFWASFGNLPFPNLDVLLRDLRELRSLSIDGGQLNDDSFRQIASLNKLRYLSLVGSHQISDQAILMLGERSTLEWLEISGRNNSLEITKHLGGLKGLQGLSLSAWVRRKKGQPLKPDLKLVSLEAIQRLKCLPKLEILILNGNGFSDEAVLALADYPNLKRIAVEEDNLAPETLIHLKERLPNCIIGSLRLGISYSQNLD